MANGARSRFNDSLVYSTNYISPIIKKSLLNMTKVKIDYDEKRRETRFPINSTVKITLPSSATPVIGTCCNISGSGLQIRTDKNIPVDKEVLIDISEGKIEFSAEAIIVRSQAEENGFVLGIKVTNQLK